MRRDPIRRCAVCAARLTPDDETTLLSQPKRLPVEVHKRCLPK